MDKTLLRLINLINSYISENPEGGLLIVLSTEFYQQIILSNRDLFNLKYDPPKLLGHSFSVRDGIDFEGEQFYVTNINLL